jgi:hypothetical protein
MLIIESDRDRRAAAYFSSVFGPNYAEKYGPGFEAWLKGRKPYTSNFAKFTGIEIPEAVASGTDSAARVREIRASLRQRNSDLQPKQEEQLPPDLASA